MFRFLIKVAIARLCTSVDWSNCTFKLVDTVACRSYSRKPGLFRSETRASCLSSPPRTTCSVAGLSQDQIPGGEQKGEHQVKGDVAVTAPGSSAAAASCPTSRRPTPGRICVSRSARGSRGPVPHSSCRGPSRRHGPAVGHSVLVATLRALNVPAREGTVSHTPGSGQRRDEPSSAGDGRRPSPQEALPRRRTAVGTSLSRAGRRCRLKRHRSHLPTPGAQSFPPCKAFYNHKSHLTRSAT